MNFSRLPRIKRIHPPRNTRTLTRPRVSLFVVEDAPSEVGKQAIYPNAIYHIQDAEEIRFHPWNETLEFMNHYVPLDQVNDTSNPLKKKP